MPRSNFFTAARSGRWETEEVPVDLTDHTTDTFDAYMHIVYFSTVVAFEMLDGFVAWHKYFALYRLADKLGDLVSANLIVDDICHLSKVHEVVPSPTQLAGVWALAPAHSPLCNLLIDWFVHENFCDFREEGIPYDMLLAVYNEFTRLRLESEEGTPIGDVFGVDLLAEDKCRYHQHDDEHPMCVS